MACRQVLLLAVAAACLASPAAAVEWKVGDDGGWRAGFNRTGWADGKIFRVGDTLRFTYSSANHTAIRVNREDFAACNREGDPIDPRYSGDDVFQLDEPGTVWFICSTPKHCDLGMKLAVVVHEATPAPAPAPLAPEPAPLAPEPAPSATDGHSSSAPASLAVGGAVAAMVAAALAF